MNAEYTHAGKLHTFTVAENVFGPPADLVISEKSCCFRRPLAVRLELECWDKDRDVAVYRVLSKVKG